MANRFPLIFNSGAGQIQELAASDNLDLTSSNLVNAGILFTSSGSATAPSLQIGSGTTYNPGLYSPGTDQVAVATNGTGRLFVDASGNVSVASSAVSFSPKVFNVRSTSGAVSSFSSADTVTGAADTGPVLDFRAHNGSAEVGVGEIRFAKENSTSGNNASYFSIGTRASGGGIGERLRITSAGLVGIGASAPTNQLTVKAANDDGIALTRPSNQTIQHLLISTTETGGDQYKTKFNTFNTDFVLSTYAGGGTGGNIRFRTGTAVDPTDKVVITSAGLVGIGTTSPAAALDVRGNAQIFNSGGGSGLEIGVGTTTSQNAFIDLVGDATFTDYGLRVIRTSGGANGNSRLEHRGTGLFSLNAIEAGAITFLTTNTERARIDSSGRLLVGTVTQVGNVNGGILQLGSGITFPATAVAASDANTLDDYEEGTWTPSIGGNATYVVQQGTYIKIGKIVQVTFQVSISVKGTGGNTQIVGLPFTAAAKTGGGGVAYWLNTATAVTYISAYIYNTTNIDLYSATAAATGLGSSSIFANNATVQACITYEAA